MGTGIGKGLLPRYWNLSSRNVRRRKEMANYERCEQFQNRQARRSRLDSGHREEPRWVSQFGAVSASIEEQTTGWSWHQTRTPSQSLVSSHTTRCSQIRGLLRMSTWMLLTVSSLYFITGLQEASKGHWWWLLFWSCYAVANIAWIKAQWLQSPTKMES